ncbi:glucose sorbosone dehydrogenase [Thozetella sp. PMI_491]|nr:glucose sorbosone dehydrogenase [Thozetella sp. PMI_491]
MSRSLSIFQAAVAVLANCQAILANTVPRQTCSNVLTPSYPAPVVASGWQSQLVVKGLSSPRGITFDDQGALLVAQAGTGIARITFQDNGGTCLVATTTQLLSQTDLTHGIALSADGKTLYASSAEAVYSWSYDSAAGVAGSDRATIINNMTNDDHVSRTLTLSKKQPTQLLVSRGSAENLDDGTRDITTGRSQIRVFDLDNIPENRPYDYSSEGRILGWGLRNDVGVAEEPTTGGIYSVENSVDNLARDGVDIHTNNPGEELNYFGPLSDEPTNPPPNYGYPDCLSVWNLTGVPNSGNLEIGMQITSTQTSTINDSYCAQTKVAPRLTFQAHMAPLDLLFKPDGSAAYISFHGSWNRSPPIGYRLTQIAFANGEPVEPATSTTALIDIMTNSNLNLCPGSCFRPVGLALDSAGRLFMTSDATGEIYVLLETA